MLRVLAQGIQSLGPKLTPEQAQAALGLFLGSLRHTLDPDMIWALAQAAKTLGATPDQAQAALGRVLEAIRRTKEPDDIGALAQAANALGATPEQARAALGPVLVAIRQTNNYDQREALAQAVQTLGPKLTPEQAQVALGPILDAIQKAFFPSERLALAEAVQALGATPKQAEAALRPLLEDAEMSRGPDDLRALAQAVQSLGPRLSPEQARAAVEILRPALASTAEPRLAEPSARVIALTLPADSAKPQAYVAAIIELLKWPTAAQPGATEALLEVLHDRVPGAPGKEAGLDATVQWVAATFPEIDLDSPPTPPASGSTGGAW